MTFRYVVAPVLGGAPIGELELSNVKFNDPVAGKGGSFEGQAEITNTQTVDALRGLTEPDQVALYVKDDSNDTYYFGGPVFARPWSRSSRRLTVQAQSWKSWFYQKLLTMNMATNPVTDTTFSFTSVDQFIIARSLLTTALTDNGTPDIAMGPELSGVLRDLNFHGSDFKYLGDQIDSMANRDDGFEWYVAIVPDVNGYPSLRFIPAFPIRGGLNSQVLIIHQQRDGGNVLALGDPEESAADRRARVWATGSGQPPDQLVAFDSDPGLTGGFLLLRETVQNYNSIVKITTLADHARAARIYYEDTLQQVTVNVSLINPDYTLYQSGDKVSMIVEDDWINWDFDSVRIVDRQFKVAGSGDNPAPDSVDLLIDLNDTQLPQDVAVV
jgi:hypothetical protein